MGRSQKNDNFIDKTFTVMADILLKVLPASKQEKQAFFYYRDGMSAQSDSTKHGTITFTSKAANPAPLTSGDAVQELFFSTCQRHFPNQM